MKVDLSKPFKALDGTTDLIIDDKTLIMGQYLADKIASEQMGDQVMSMVMFDFATTLYQAKGEIEINESHREIIKKACGKMIVMFSAQILKIVNNAN